PPLAFQEKLADIQKNQGKAVAPARLAAPAKREGAERPRLHPAAETGRGDLARRNPGAGPALQPVTEARGKKLATRSAGDGAQAMEPERTPAPSPAPSKE